MPKTPNVQVSAEHYEEEGFSPLRIESLTRQVNEIVDSRCRVILEIGVGRGLLKHFLCPFPEIHHTGVDIAEDLHPDVVGSVLDLPFDENAFELTLCCQVLEHLPFDQFEAALREIKQVTKHRVILSLPDVRKHAGLAVRIPGIRPWLKWELNIDPPGLGPKLFDGQHHWEIGYQGSRGRDVTRIIRRAGFKIIRAYRLETHRWHSFFILQVD